MEAEKNTAKEFLLQLKRIDALINSKQEDLDWLYCIATKSTASWGGEMVSGTRSMDKLGDVGSKIADMQTEINSYIDKLVDKRQEVKAVIEQLRDSEQIKVLCYLYVGLVNKEKGEVQYLSWKEIADKIHVSERTAQRIHGNALKEIEKILKKEEVDAFCP
jgi:DNA-directed RNA polymerase specialized sigma subunit